MQDLAVELNTTPERLIEWFSVRAIYELWNVAIIALIIAALIILMKGAVRLSKRIRDSQGQDTDDDDILGAISLILLASFTGILVLSGFLPFVTHNAIMAMASPEAYAIEEILKLLKGDE